MKKITVTARQPDIETISVLFNNIEIIMQNKQAILNNPDFYNICINGISIGSAYTGEISLPLGVMYSNNNYYAYLTPADGLTANRTLSIPDSSGTLLTDARVSFGGANVLSRTSGLNISSRQSTLICNGEIVVVYLALTGNTSLAVGDNAFVGTLNTTNIPVPKWSAHDVTYYGSTVFVGYIDTSGNIQVRVTGAGTNIGSDVIAFTFTYLKA